MNFDLDDVSRSVEAELKRFSDARLARMGEFGPHDEASWRELATFGLLHGVVDGMRHIDVAVGMTAAARGGLPGPVLEATLAIAAGSTRAAEFVADGKFVTSVVPGTAGRVIVGWGGIADLVVDQANGGVLSEVALEPVKTALPMEHGWIDRPAAGVDSLQTQRWLLASALVVGLGDGAIHLATEHVKTRHQFGRSLASFQAVQFRLSESVLKLDAARHMAFDAARRLDADDPLADVSAAMAWIYTSRIVEELEKNVHQVHGAMGFTEEVGLIRMTYQSHWLRTSVARSKALALVSTRRTTADPVPASIVMDGFATL